MRSLRVLWSCKRLNVSGTSNETHKKWLFCMQSKAILIFGTTFLGLVPRGGHAWTVGTSKLLWGMNEQPTESFIITEGGEGDGIDTPWYTQGLNAALECWEIVRNCTLQDGNFGRILLKPLDYSFFFLWGDSLFHLQPYQLNLHWIHDQCLLTFSQPFC